MKTLVVVDMQNDFVTGVLGSSHAKAIVPNVVAKVQEYLDNGDCVIFTMDTHLKETYLNTREGKNLPVPHCILMTEGQNLIPELEKIVDKYINEKINVNGIEINQVIVYAKHDQFGLPIYGIDDPEENIGEIYKELESFEFIGVATNICVISCAICSQNIYKNIDHIIDASCCASFDPVLHVKALDLLEGLQFKVINRTEYLAEGILNVD